jgi:hypothetical protein
MIHLHFTEHLIGTGAPWSRSVRHRVGSRSLGSAHTFESPVDNAIPSWPHPDGKTDWRHLVVCTDSAHSILDHECIAEDQHLDKMLPLAIGFFVLPLLPVNSAAFNFICASLVCNR